MYPRHLVLVRFDYVLPENADELYEKLADQADGKPNDFSWSTLRDDIRRDQTFEFDGNRLSPDFERVNIRVVESNSAFVEVISIAEVSRSSLVDLAFEREGWRRRHKLSELEQDIANVRLWIPGDEQGSETTLYWTDVYPIPPSLTDSSVSTGKLKMAFQDGVESRFLHDFRVSAGRGIVKLSDEEVMFLGSPKKMFDRALVINLDGSLRRTRNGFVAPGSLSLDLPGQFVALSTLYGIHFWCKARGKQIDEIEEDIKDASDDLPANTSLDPEETLNLDLTVFELQADWTKLHARISSEQAELLERIRSVEIDYEDTGMDTIATDDSDEGIGLLAGYISSLEDEVENIGADDERVDDVFNSLSEYTSNQLDVVASQERQQASEQSRELQKKVLWLTWIVAGLTVVLTVDALAAQGLGSFVYGTIGKHLDKVPTRYWINSIGVLMIFTILASAIYDNNL